MMHSCKYTVHKLQTRTGWKFGGMKLLGWGNGQKIQLHPQLLSNSYFSSNYSLFQQCDARWYWHSQKPVHDVSKIHSAKDAPRPREPHNIQANKACALLYVMRKNQIVIRKVNSGSGGSLALSVPRGKIRPLGARKWKKNISFSLT